jgi:hypothetical protein
MRSLNSADVVRHRGTADLVRHHGTADLVRNHGTAHLVRNDGSAQAVPVQTNSTGYVDPTAKVRLCLLSHEEVRA